MMRSVIRVLAAGLPLVLVAAPARAGDADSTPADAAVIEAPAPGRLLGILPNHMTVDSSHATVQTTHDAFRAASLNTFDPVVYPTVGVLTMFGGGQNSSYATRYSRAFADNAVGNLMTSAVVPSLAREDSRYYRRGSGRMFSRVSYAASRSIVTRSRTGATTFNLAEVAGNGAAAALSNVYYAPADRTADATLRRWGTQVMWDTVSNELKEFWPDIRQKLHRR